MYRAQVLPTAQHSLKQAPVSDDLERFLTLWAAAARARPPGVHLSPPADRVPEQQDLEGAPTSRSSSSRP